MILQVGFDRALARVRYLEFEYNWMGAWEGQPLSGLVRRLDEELAFTCYWPGKKGAAWRITGCWLDHYDVHFWGNVACVNRNAMGAQRIAERLERRFAATLARGDELVMDASHRFPS